MNHRLKKLFLTPYDLSFMTKSWHHKSVVNLIKESGNPNPEEEIRNRARELVLKAFTKEWTGPPFDIIALAQMLGIEVSPNDGTPDARISPKGKDKFLI